MSPAAAARRPPGALCRAGLNNYRPLRVRPMPARRWRPARPTVTPTNIIEAMGAPDWWRKWFADWTAWSALLAAAFALPPQDDAALDIYRECTGRSA